MIRGGFFCCFYDSEKIRGKLDCMKSVDCIERNQKIVEDYRNGLTVSELANKYGLSGRSCYRLIEDPEQTARIKKVEYQKNRNEEIIRLLLEGLSVQQVAEKLNVNLRLCYRIVGEYNKYHNNGISITASVKKTRNKKIADAYRYGTNVCDLAKQYGLAASSIYAILKKEGASG